MSLPVLGILIFGGVALLVAIHIGLTCAALGAPKFIDRLIERKRRLSERRMRATRVTMAARIVRRV